MDLISVGVSGTGSEVTFGSSGPGVALDGIAPLHATRIEHDDVEVVEHSGSQGVQLVRHVIEPRDSRTAGVDDERSDAGRRVVGRMRGNSDRNGWASRIGVVQRDDQRAALQIAHTRCPAHRRDRRLRRRRGRRSTGRGFRSVAQERWADEAEGTTQSLTPRREAAPRRREHHDDPHAGSDKSPRHPGKRRASRSRKGSTPGATVPVRRPFRPRGSTDTRTNCDEKGHSVSKTERAADDRARRGRRIGSGRVRAPTCARMKPAVGLDTAAWRPSSTSSPDQKRRPKRGPRARRERSVWADCSTRWSIEGIRAARSARSQDAA